MADSCLVRTFVAARRAALGACLVASLAAGARRVSADVYVSSGGDDSAPGTSADHPIKTLQQADALVKPGDTVWIMKGTYRNATKDEGGGSSSLLAIKTSGTPDAWITWRAYRDDKPELIAVGCWNAIDVRASYIAIQGLTLTGNNDNVRQADAEANSETDQLATLGSTEKLDETISPNLKEGTAAAKALPERGKPKAMQPPSPLYNGGAIAINSRGMPPGTFQHHVRVKDCVLRKFAGGVSMIGVDYMTVEGCEIYDNCWYCRYGSSGISQLGGKDFDRAPGYHNVFRNNRVYRNKELVRCTMVDRFTDGNGIILDSLGDGYHGDILIENNLVYDNGGGGIHVFKSRAAHIDVAFNTLWRNQQSFNLYDMGALASKGVRFSNNVVVADRWKTVVSPQDMADVTYENNLYFGGAPVEKLTGTNQFVDPRLSLPSTNRQAGDFRPRPDSPAVGTATADLLPATDFDGAPRPTASPANRGAFQTTGTPAAASTRPAR